MKKNMTGFEKFLTALSPKMGRKRFQERMRTEIQVEAFGRSYNAATVGRRTAGWERDFGDVNTTNARALVELRLHSRNLAENNGWAVAAIETITDNTVGWGIDAEARGGDSEVAAELWKAFAGGECDTERRATFGSLQEQVLRSVIIDGEVLIRRRPRLPVDGLKIPLQIQILEADFLDTAKDGILGPAGGPIIQGVEFDKIGRRVAYWLFSIHPGAGNRAQIRQNFPVSSRVPASEVLHVFRSLRPGQVRGVPWLAQTIVPLKDFDEYEDATLNKQKVAACFAVFVTDVNGTADGLADPDDSDPTDDKLEMIEPGATTYLQAGRDVKFATPPHSGDDSFTTRNLRRISKGAGVTYEDLSGDYSQVNFSSARLARLAHWVKVRKWQWNLMIPQFCSPVWNWAMSAAMLDGTLKVIPDAEWTPPPMPMIDPAAEVLADSRSVRNGFKTLSDVIKERGGDPQKHLARLAKDFADAKALGLTLDSNPADVSAAGLKQMLPGASGGGFGGAKDKEDAA